MDDLSNSQRPANEATEKNSRSSTARRNRILRRAAIVVGVLLFLFYGAGGLSLIHISEPTRLKTRSRMPSSA